MHSGLHTEMFFLNNKFAPLIFLCLLYNHSNCFHHNNIMCAYLNVAQFLSVTFQLKAVQQNGTDVEHGPNEITTVGTTPATETTSFVRAVETFAGGGGGKKEYV